MDSLGEVFGALVEVVRNMAVREELPEPLRTLWFVIFMGTGVCTVVSPFVAQWLFGLWWRRRKREP